MSTFLFVDAHFQVVNESSNLIFFEKLYSILSSTDTFYFYTRLSAIDIGPEAIEPAWRVDPEDGGVYFLALDWHRVMEWRLTRRGCPAGAVGTCWSEKVEVVEPEDVCLLDEAALLVNEILYNLKVIYSFVIS